MATHVIWQTLCVVWISAMAASIFAQDLKLEIVFHRQPNVIYAFHPLQGTCSLTDGNSGQLHLMIYDKNNRMTESFQLETTQSSQKIASKVVEGGKYKRSVAFKLCPLTTMKGGQIVCALKNSVGNVISEKSVSPKILYPPQILTLKLQYHLKPRTILDGEEMKITCGAIVGDRGHMGFKLTWQKGGTQFWNVTWRDFVPFTERSAKYSGRFLFTEKRSKIDLGPYIYSALLIKVTRFLAGAKISCFTSDLSIEETKANKRGLRVEKALPPLVVQEWKAITALSVNKSYEQDSNGKHIWHVHGFCSRGTTKSERPRMHLLLQINDSFYAYTSTVIGNLKLKKYQTRRKNEKGKEPSSLLLEEIGRVSTKITHDPDLSTTALSFNAYLDARVKWVTVSCIQDNVLTCQRVLAEDDPTVQNFEENLSPLNFRTDIWEKEALAAKLALATLGGILLFLVCMFLVIKMARGDRPQQTS